MYTEYIHSIFVFVTGPAKINHLSAKNHWFCSSLVYHNMITIYTTAIKSSSLMQNLMGCLLQLMEIDTTFWTEDISGNITQCNMHSHDLFSQAQSHFSILQFSSLRRVSFCGIMCIHMYQHKMLVGCTVYTLILTSCTIYSLFFAHAVINVTGFEKTWLPWTIINTYLEISLLIIGSIIIQEGKLILTWKLPWFYSYL